LPNRSYEYALFYFILFSLLFLASSAILFFVKIGFSYDAVLHYYTGNEELFIASKSYSGLLKVILPHVFAFGLFIMVILHFLIFTKKRETKELRYIIYLSFVSAFLEIFSPFAIIRGYHFFVYLKIISFITLELLLLYALYLMLKSILAK